MEARRAYEQGASRSKQTWNAVAALLAVAILGVVGAFLVKGLTAASAPASGHVVQTGFQAPDAQDRNLQILHSNSGPVLIDRNAQPPYRESHGY